MYDIAICDDSAQDRSTLKDDIMKCEIYSEHIRFHEYCSGKELLSAIGIAHFSIIFLDIQMRDLDGQKTAETAQDDLKTITAIEDAETGWIEEIYKANGIPMRKKAKKGDE